MGQFFLKLLIFVFTASTLTACGNVRFSADPSQGDNGVQGNGASDPGANGANGATGTNDTGGIDPNVPGSNGTGITPGTVQPTPSPTPVGSHAVRYDLVVPPASNKVDFLLVIDNSTSMAADQVKLASQMKGFAEKLATLNIDWQMCLTTTTFATYPNGQFWGHSISWNGYTPSSGSKYVLRPAEAGSSLNSIFINTISAIGVNETAGDERGIKAAYNHLINGAPGNNVANSGGCYRSGAAISIILLSDEDERSVGGDSNRVKIAKGESVGSPNYTYRALEDQDLPSNLLSMSKGLFGQNLRLTFNSIIVESQSCETTQDNTVWTTNSGQSVTSASHMGTKYIEASNLTGGGISSICNANFQDNLNLFTQKITNSLKNITLECAPTPITSLLVKIGGNTAVRNTDYSVSGAALSFTNAVVQGTRIEMSYMCQ